MTRDEAIRLVYGTGRWANVRRQVLRRDRFTCAKCGRSARNRRGLLVHHVIPLSRGGDPWRLDNLETQCVPCHAETHRVADMDPQRLAWRERFGV